MNIFVIQLKTLDLVFRLEKEETMHGFINILENLLLEGKTLVMFKGDCLFIFCK